MKHYASSFLVLLLLYITGIHMVFAQQLSAGDVAFIGYQSDTPKQFAFIALNEISEGTEIFFTDNGWKKDGYFRNTEGIIKYTSQGLSKNDIVCIKDSTSSSFSVYGGGILEQISGDFNLSATGDQIFAYQNNANLRIFLAGLHFRSAAWDSDATSSNTSALPDQLTNGLNAIALSHKDNGIYTGPLTGTREELLGKINNSKNWYKEDDFGFSMKPEDYPYNVWSAASGDWNTETDWVAGILPDETYHVYIPESKSVEIASSTNASCKKITIETGATIKIKASAESTGSLITNSVTGTGTAETEVYIPGDDWHIVSVPVSGQKMLSFAQTNSIDSFNDGSKTDYDLAPYNETANEWSPYLPADGSNQGSFIPAKGYALRRTIAAGAGVVSFSGSLTAGVKTLPLARNNQGWNAVGNPYSSSIKGTGTGSFQEINSPALDPAYSGLYVWDHNQNDYLVYAAGEAKNLVPGQGFIVRSKVGGGEIAFTPDLQIHLQGELLKSEELPWPKLEISIQSGNLKNSAVVTFNERMTLGMDPMYDVGKLKGNPELALFTHFPDDNGIDLAVQALPDFTDPNLRIPVGIDYKSGGDVVLSARLINFPPEAALFLEDNENQTFIPINQENITYPAFIKENQKGAGRFSIVTSKNSTRADQFSLQPAYRIYTKDKQIFIDGEANSDTHFELYGIDGKLRIILKAEDINRNKMDCSLYPAGFYVLRIKHYGYSESHKIILPN